LRESNTKISFPTKTCQAKKISNSPNPD